MSRNEQIARKDLPHFLSVSDARCWHHSMWSEVAERGGREELLLEARTSILNGIRTVTATSHGQVWRSAMIAGRLEEIRPFQSFQQALIIRGLEAVSAPGLASPWSPFSARWDEADCPSPSVDVETGTALLQMIDSLRRIWSGLPKSLLGGGRHSHRLIRSDAVVFPHSYKHSTMNNI
jgi:hypothetical protein